MCRQQLAACEEAGIPTDVYVWLWFGEDVNRVRARIDRNCSGFSVRHWWLDVEDNAGASGVAYNVGEVNAKLALLEEYGPTGLYSGYWFWTGYMGNGTWFHEDPLWTAQYDQQADASLFLPYGGWTECAIKQWRGTSTLEGQSNVDLNVVA